MNSARIAGFEGIRAYAVSLVFLVHFFVQYFNGHTSATRIDFDAHDVTRPATATEAIAHYFWASHYGVDLFFLLSGFLIYKIISRKDFSYLRFLRDRFTRLYPAFLLAVVVHLIYMAKFWHQTFDWSTIASNVFLLHGISEWGIQAIIIPTWSLTYEWLFYLVFPGVLLLRKARSRISCWHLGIFALLLLAFVVLVGSHYVRFFMFLLGATLACLSGESLRKIALRLPDWLVITVYMVGNLIFVADQTWYRFIPVYLFTSAALVIKIAYGDGVLHRAFCWQPLRHIGNVSYSFYLFHGLAIIVVCDHIGPHIGGLPDIARLLVLLIGSFALSSLAAMVSYELLEKPYFERKRRTEPFKVSPHAGESKGIASTEIVRSRAHTIQEPG